MGIVTAIVESPKGSNHKYDFEPASGRFKLKKVLPAGLVFPFDFGFLPDTKGEDGDPLDIVIISEICGFPGCEIDCRLIGVLKAEQQERNGEVMRNDRFLGVPVVSQLFSAINDIIDFPDPVINQLEAFFTNYNQQAGKKFKVLERLGAKAASDLLNNS